VSEAIQSRPVSDSKISITLVLLKRLDALRLHPRDAVVLYYVLRNPGSSRTDIAAALGLNAEVNVRLPTQRLIRQGLLEDRRPAERRLVASLLHVTPKGEQVWQELIR
jgi:DNA-binding MarR family transcriptional regulator